MLVLSKELPIEDIEKIEALVQRNYDLKAQVAELASLLDEADKYVQHWTFSSDEYLDRVDKAIAKAKEGE